MSDTIENINKSINEPSVPTPSAFKRGREVARLEEFQDPHDIRVQGSQHEKDRVEYFADLEARKARAAAMEEKRREHLKPVEPKVEFSAIDSVLSELDAAADDFEQTYLKPNLPLIEARNKVERLRSELAGAEAELEAIEARGDSVQRLTNAVGQAEAQLQSLVSKAEAEEVSRLAEQHYGWPIPYSKISPEMKREFALHHSVLVFKKFYVPRSIVLPGQIPSVDALQAQLQRVGESLVALRDHLSQADA